LTTQRYACHVPEGAASTAIKQLDTNEALQAKEAEEKVREEAS
jgi:chemotaxis response regulator CheB